MNLSIIIPCFNGAQTIGVQLDALAKQQWSGAWEIIVVNNRSTDNSMEIVEGYKNSLPNLRIVEASDRQGQPYAINFGASVASGEAIAFCDADDEVSPGWVLAMGEALSKKYEFAACRVDLQKLNPPWVFEGIGFHSQTKGLQSIKYPPFLPHAGGGTIGVKRALFEQMGGFDETFPYLHDTDLCFKLQMKGVTLHFVPDALTHIRLKDSFKGIFYQARNWAEYNVKLYKKYMILTGTTLPHPWKTYLREWRSILRQLVVGPKAKKDLARLVQRLGWQIGLLKGSLKHRVTPV